MSLPPWGFYHCWKPEFTGKEDHEEESPGLQCLPHKSLHFLSSPAHSGTAQRPTCSLAAKQPSTAGHPGPGAPGFVSTALPWAGATDFKQRNSASSSPVHQAFPEKNQGWGGDKGTHGEGTQQLRRLTWQLDICTAQMKMQECAWCSSGSNPRSEDQGSWCCNFRLSTPGWGSASTPLRCPVDWRGLLTLCLPSLPTHMSVSA